MTGTQFVIDTVETTWVTGEHSIQVTFQLPYRCWHKLSKKKFWQKVQRFLEEEERSLAKISSYRKSEGR